MRGVSNPCGAGNCASSGHKRRANQQPDSSAEDGEERALDEELSQNILISGAQRFAQADLPGALGHRDQHDVDDADRAQRQSHEAHHSEKVIHGVEYLVHALRVLDRVPVFEGIFQLGIEAVAARDDLVDLLFGLQVLRPCSAGGS